jgi:hypothetical protein
MQQITINPELQRLIPPLSHDELMQLEANILAQGIREPIIVWQNTIVDGHNRYEIAQRHGLDYNVNEYHFDSLNHCKEWMIRNQFGRRNLSLYDRGVLALELKNLFKDKAKQNLIKSGKVANASLRANLKGCHNCDNPMSTILDTVDTKKELAKIANVSHNTIARIEVIQSNASEELKNKLRTGQMSINQAYEKIKLIIKKDNAVKTVRDEMLIAKLKSGKTIVVNQTTDIATIKYAEEHDLYVRADRYSDWGNPFEIQKDGDRDTVCHNYEVYYLPHKPSLLSKIQLLKGKALGCWCSPLRCHCDSLLKLIK